MDPFFQQVQELYPDKQIGDSCGYRFQPGVTRLTTGLVILTWSCARVTSVTYPRQTGGEPLVKGDGCFGREFEKGVECEASGIMCVAMRCMYVCMQRMYVCMHVCMYVCMYVCNVM